MTKKDASKSPDSVLATCERGHTWAQSTSARKNGRGCPFCARKRAWLGETDLFTEVPWTRDRWDFHKNVDLDPHQILKASEKIAWWNCDKGHSFQKSVGQMVLTGCSYCSNRLLLVGFNDLKTVRPDLAAEFDDERNGSLSSSDLIYGTSRKIWWRCPNGHSYEAKVSQRNFSNSGCKFCQGKQVLTGFNDLAVAHPEIAASWDFERNAPVRPDTVASNSLMKFWWKCEVGHSWIARVGDRTKKQGCAVCANRQVLVGFNDLQTVSPELTETLAPGKNPENFALTVVSNSKELAWWVCPQGHFFQVSVARRQRSGCGVCAGQVVLSGYNDLESQNPNAAAHFLQGRNGVAPSQVHVNSRVHYWWECRLGHSFRTHPDSIRKGNWCPFCGNKRVLRGFNDLETVAPDLAAEWHPTRNGATFPFEVLNGSHAKYWWLCSAGHSFAQSGKKRRAGQGCPGCAKSGFNPSLPALLYVLVKREAHAIKAGITNADSDNRLKQFRESGWKVVSRFRFERGYEAEAAESSFFTKIRLEQNIPVFLGAQEMKRTGGWTETMSLDLASEAFVLATLDEVFFQLGFVPTKLDALDN